MCREKSESNEDEAQPKAVEVTSPKPPVILGRSPVVPDSKESGASNGGYSPSFKSAEAPKLLKRRESLAPVRLRGKLTHSDFEPDDSGEFHLPTKKTQIMISM